MDFFEAQDRAKRSTGKLVAIYLLAVVMIIVSIYLVLLVLLRFAGFLPYDVPIGELIWQPVLLGYVAMILVLIIITGTLFRIVQLRKGGSAVAEMLGGRRVEPSTRDPKERQLINVVEEMSIASGLPVPDVYILDREDNINAFAAGFGTADAAVGVTRGTLDKLTRDELQGVIAHEFSHIFNGDMRLNIRLIGILNGILLLHIMGLIMMRGGAYSSLGGGGRSGGRGGGGGGSATLVIILLGLALLIIGYIGMMFGRIIQAAISRQREYLADAAAVQYTRNPDGIAGALRKIGNAMDGGKIEDGHAMEMSHLFFANSFHTALDRMFATHPPIEDRIRAIDPSATSAEDRRKKERIRKRLEKDRIARAEAVEQHGSAGQRGASGQRADGSSTGGSSTGGGALEDFFGSQEGAAGGTSITGGIEAAHPALRPEVILAAIGTLDGEQVSRAGKLLQSIPVSLREAAHEPFGAEALIFALLLAEREPAADRVPRWLGDRLDTDLTKYTEKILTELKKGNREWFLPLAELALPTLRQMSEEQYRTFRQNVEHLIREDEQVSLFEFALEKLIVHQLDTAFSKQAEVKTRHYHLKTLGNEISLLLSAMAHASDSDSQKAWEAGIQPIKSFLPDGIRFMELEECTTDDLDAALKEVNASANPVKKYILTALIHCITTDGKVTVRERELMRAISEAIEAPIPLGIL